MEKMAFKDNLLRKIELDRLAFRVKASCRIEQVPRRIDRESMQRLLVYSTYRHRHERDLDLYIKPLEGEFAMILVLDNELPIFRSTVKDVVTRRSPRTLELWNFFTIRRILVDSDIRMSTGEGSVETILRDAVSQLDLAYTDEDIIKLAREGMAWLAGKNANGVEEILSLFAALLGYVKPTKYFGLDKTISYGVSSSGKADEAVFGPLVLYRPADNMLAWIDRSFSRSDREQMEILRTLAAGRASVPVTGDEVFAKLQANVLDKPHRLLLSEGA